MEKQNGIVDNLPIEIWENILVHLSYGSWKNLAKAYDIVNDAIEAIKKAEIIKCKKNVTRIPFEHYLELEECPKKISRERIIEAYVNHWKFHGVDKITLKSIKYSDTKVTVDYMNISGLWVFLYSHQRGWNGFRMVHLTTLFRDQLSCPWSRVQKFTFERSVDFKVQPCHCSGKNDINCWCMKDLSHDTVQLLPISHNIIQGDIHTKFLQLHSKQHVAYDSDFVKQNHACSGKFYASHGKFKLVFHPQFGFDEASFASDVKTPEPYVFVFDGPQAILPKRRILLDVSVNSLSGSDTFRAILFILDQMDSTYKLLFLRGPHIINTLVINAHLSLWLFRGALALGLRPGGKLTLISSRTMRTLVCPSLGVSCAALRGNLLVLGTREGALLCYRARGRASDLHKTIGLEKELRVARVGIQQVVFVSSPGPELLLLTIQSELYHVKL